MIQASQESQIQAQHLYLRLKEEGRPIAYTQPPPRCRGSVAAPGGPVQCTGDGTDYSGSVPPGALASHHGVGHLPPARHPRCRHHIGGRPSFAGLTQPLTK
ncbi:unnamed protein product [Merluccius merluccius]